MQFLKRPPDLQPLIESTHFPVLLPLAREILEANFRQFP